MGFIILLVLTTLSIAGTAAFFSIYGLAQIFSGTFWSVVVMASSLEIGKLVAASYVYRYWNKIGFTLKLYLISAIIVLMIITSAGIFGYLTKSYQEGIIDTKTNQQQVELLTAENEQLEQLKTERLDRKKQIDADIASLPNNFITGRQRLMKSYGDELAQLRLDIADYTKQVRDNTKKIAELKAINLQEEVHVGPIIFIAKVFEQNLDDTTKWLILIIIFAFDPLAVALTVSANMVLIDRQKEKGRSHSKFIETYEEVVGVDPEQFEEKEPELPINIIEEEPETPTILEQPTESITSDQIKKALEDFQNKELSPSELAQKGMLEEMLRRKQVTERIRTGER